MPTQTVSTDLRLKVDRNFTSYVIGDGSGFGKHIGDRIQVTELAYCLGSTEAVTVCEISVMEDMLNVAEGTLHPSCAAYLIDMCTALPFILLGLAEQECRGDSKDSKFAMAPFAPSQRLDVTYHHPACLGAHLRIICKSVTHVSRELVVRGEIWDTANDLLVADATHCKVMPKKPPLAAHAKL